MPRTLGRLLSLALLTLPAALPAFAGVPLIDAAQSGDVEAVRKLLAEGADVSATNDYGATALSYAADSGNLEILRLLIEKGADVNHTDTFYKGPVVIWAGFNGHGEATRLLVEHGADPAAAMRAGMEAEEIEVVAAVLETGKASAEQLTEALSLATARELTEIAGLLEKAGAKPAPPSELDPAPETETGAETETATAPVEDTATAEAAARAKVPAGAAGRDWPAFRGPNAAGTAKGDVPLTWDVATGDNILWKRPIPGRAHSSPIVWDDRIFVTTAISSAPEKPFRTGLYGDVDEAEVKDDYAWRIYALDKAGGKVLWQHETTRGLPRAAHHFKATQANATPVTNGKVVVAMMGSEGLFCYDLEGKLLWQKDLGVLEVGWFYNPGYGWGHSSSPIIHRDRVIVQVDRYDDPFIAAYALADGRELWRTARENLPSWGTPAMTAAGGRTEIVTNGSRWIRGYDADSGEELWHLAPISEVTVGTPVVGHGLVFVTGGYSPARPIYAIRPGGRGDISLAEGAESSDHIAWRSERDGTYIPTPLVYGDYLYLTANNGALGCYDARTGKRLYRARVAGRGGVAFSASPVAAAGRLYFASEDGEVYVGKAGPEYQLLATNVMGEVVMATPAISGDTLFIRTLENLYAIGMAATADPERASR